jgi:outer membrane murein-binding lipoprotein Lpp
MTLTLDERVEVLEGKVENLETWAGPGQNEAFSRNLREFRQETNAKLTALSKDVGGLTTKVDKLQAEFTGLKAEVTGLKTEVTGLKAEFAQHQVDFVGFTNHVRGELSGLDMAVCTLRSDVTAVKETLAEILDRLPPKAA